jgi:hypothetical protein
MPLYLTCRSPESLFAVILSLFSTMDVLTFFLEFGESGCEFVAFIEELSHLRE